jgi:sodium-coupled neutral amino acid transporter 9
MATIPVGDKEESNLIESILSDFTLTDDQINDKIENTKKERKSRKQSSFRTIFNISNTMMGSALLVMPINFYISGMLSAFIGAIIMAIISYVTCNLIIIHSREDEIDYPEAILRILGRPWAKTFNFMSMILLYLVGLIHFVLMSETFYAILKNMFSNSSSWAPTDKIDFSTFSMQYVGLVIFILCGLLFSIRNLKNILAINDKGVYMILIFSLFMVYLGLDALFRCDITYSAFGTPGKENRGLEIVLFTSDIQNLLGIFALAYMIHNVIAGIMKNNKNPNNNSRDLGISYLLVFTMYSILGMFGMFGIAALYNSVYDSYQSKEHKFPRTVMELLIKDNPYLNTAQYVLGSIALCLIFIQLSTVIPILCFFTRRQFFDFIYGPRKRLSNTQFHLFNFAYNISCLIVEFFVIDINKLVGFSGAVGGFMLIYIIPIYLHIKCIYTDQDNFTCSKLPEADQELAQKELIPRATQKCRDHSDVLIKNTIFAYLVYGSLVLIGLAILVELIIGLF